MIDIVGTDGTIGPGLGALRRGGAFVLVGSGGGGFKRPWFGGLPREATITTVQGSSIDDARQVIALAADGRVKVEVDEYPLERVADAYAALDAGTLRGRALVVPCQSRGPITSTGCWSGSATSARSVETSPNAEYV